MKTRTLRVEAPEFVANATWTKLDGDTVWLCTGAAPTLSWMKGQRADVVKAMLEKRGWKFSWLGGATTAVVQ